MAKQLNVNLAFTADTGKAKAQIQDLQNQLTKLVTTTNNQKLSVDLDNKGINEAISSVAELQAHLRKATNQKTGNLDFSKLNDSLKKSNKSLIEYGDSLRQLGPEGQKAFQTLVSSVTSAEIPMRRVNNTLNEMWTTMKNTARWQISSSIMHGFMGSVQSAYGYAKRLDESLNNIRIVTGQNTDQMAAFAEKANKAAKALSATTTQYTDAALIYYQQGLNDQEVQDRADITIKMAHASGQSAEIVSDQLTAIWNNFYNGSESLEHYADVMTALGAATASSSDEIAGGLEKFASIAEMIGLSYEYAASALATITATTRQSEDVVGTALKTIFARIQGLKLGDTLDDGTDLNKYSEALQKVGISIFEQNGELKDMDNILDEMGAKWETLSKDQQVALAQTVAGVRQYNQLVSLMDNWDFMQENVELSNNADGTLDEQADIYAESWEAASNRVRAAAEDIYDSLLDDEFFITLLNGFEDILTVIGKLIDGMGGFEGVVFSLGAVLTRVFSTQLAQSLTNASYSLTMMTESGRRKVEEERKKVLNDAKQTTQHPDFETIADKARSQALGRQVDLQSEYLDNVHKMSDIEQEVNQALLERNKLLNEQKIKAAELAAEADRKSKESKFDIEGMIAQNEMDLAETYDEEERETRLNNNIAQTQKFYKDNRKAVGDIYSVKSKLGKELDIMEGKSTPVPYSEQAKKVKELISGLSKEVKELDKNSKLNNLVSELEKATGSGEEFGIVLNKIQVELNNLEEEAQENMNLSVGANPEQVKAIEQDIKLLHEQIDTQENLNGAIEAEEGSAKKASEGIKNASGAQATWADHIVNTGNAIMALSAVISSLNSLIDVWSNSDLSIWEKLESTLMSLSTVIPMVTIALDSETAAAVRAKLANNAYITSLKNTAIGAKIASLAVGGLASKLILILGVVGAVVLAGVGLVKLFQKIQDQSPEAQISKLNEELDNCQQAFDKVKTAAEGTEEAINSLESGYDKIETLTKDTEEWARQVSNVNAEVLNLLETYPQLSKFLTEDENGLLSFQNGWKEYLNGRNDILKNSANNLVINKQNEIRAEEMKNSSTITSTNLDYVKEFRNNQDELFRLAQEFYANPEYGERLFTEEGAKDFYKALVENGTITEENAYGKNQLHNFLQTNSETLQNGYQQQQKINLIENFQLNSKLDLAQSNRSAEEALELLGVGSYSTLMDNINKKVEEDFGKWQDYTAFSNSAQKEKIAEFAELKGLENATYTGQEFGKMVFKDAEGEEHKFSKEEFFEGIGELYSVGEMQNLMANTIRENLTNIAGDTFSNIGNLEAINLDDVLLALQKNMGYEGEGYDKSLVNSLMGDAYGYDTEGIKQFTEDTQHIEWTTENTDKFKELLATFEQSTASDKVKALTSEIRELNAAGQIKGMESTFTEAAERFGFDDDAAQQMHNYAKHLIEVADESDLLDDTLDENAETAADVAIAVTRMNRGIDTLADNFKDWNSVLKKSDKASAEYADAMSGVKGALSDVLGVESDLIDSDFVENHLDEIAKAATGDAAAIDALRDSLATDILLEVTGKTNFEDVNSEIANLHNDILSMDNDIEVGATLDDEEFLTKAQELIEKSGMTVDQAQAYFNSLGYEPEFVTEEKTVKRSVPQEKTHTDYEITQGYVDIMGAQVPIPTIDRLTTTTIAGYKEMDEKIQVPAFGEDKPQIKSLTKISSGSMNNYSSSNKGGGSPGKSGGGGGSKSKPAEKVKYTKKDEVVDRYKEINDTLSDIEDTMSDINKLSNRLYGASRISQMEKEKKLLLQQADALKEKKRQAEEYLKGNAAKGIKGDKQELIDVGAKVGITWEFGDDGDILNYTSAMEGLFKELHAAEVQMDEMVTKEAQDEFKTNNIEPIEEKIEKIKDALSKYEDTKELLKELDNQLQEAIWAWQDKNFEELEYKLELKLDINDADLKQLDYLMNKWSDDFFKMAETAALMYDPDKFDQVDGYSAQLETYRDFEKSIRDQYAAGDISQADYIDGLKNVRDGYYEQLEALTELDKTMTHYYEDTLSAAKEELDDYTDHMQHITGVFEHYMNIMDLLGKQKDYETIGNFLGGKAETARDELEVAKEYYDMLLDRKDSIEAEFNNALRSGDEESIKFWQEQWDAIIDATDEAHEEMLSKTEAWIENMRAVIQNNMEKLASDLEKALTGDFMNFDVLMDSFDKLNTRQEEYLTKTNQIYETNKLIRQASQKVDQTDNKVAKQKMENFIQETKSLQQNNQLSEYELEIQQAKYELLLAEIALEEAQNAKSTVRLSRDSEGNFGYVYTADQDAVNDAEQNLDDAKNRLYNISLEGQQNYTDKYLQAQQSMYEELTELQQMWLDGELSSEEEYQKRKEEIINHYYGENGVLRTYSTLYNVAIQTDAAATADYWGKEYGEMTQHTEDWKIAVNDYLEQVEDETEDWAEVSEQANKDVEGALKDSKTATKELTNETDKLGREIKNDLIPAMDQELKRVEKAIREYDKERDAIRKMREEYERYIEAINQSIKDEANKSDKAPNDKNTVGGDKDFFFSAMTNTAGGNTEAVEKDIKDRIDKTGNEDQSYLQEVISDINKLKNEDKENLYEDLKDLGEKGYSKNDVKELLNEYGITSYNPKSFDTGGFTGVWGPEGKLAFLHQKELVLNEHDTDNMLNTVSMIRELVSMIDAGAAGSMISGLLSTPGFTNMLDHDFQQHIEIYAEFPDATDHSEIEQAFNNLLNTASQYANRKI